MNHDVSVAFLRLQNSLMSGRLQPWRAEQAEEALNGLLTQPFRTGDPFHLARNAMSDARKKLQRRAALLDAHLASADVMGRGDAFGGMPHGTDFEGLRADVVDTLRRTGSDRDNAILSIAIEGGTAGDVSEALGVTYEVAKVRLSRARGRARAAWAAV